MNSSNTIKYDIFISYSRCDKAKVNRIVELLKEQDFSVWMDTYGIESGEAFRGVIVDAIENSEIVLFFSSEASNASEWTKKEIALAVASKKYVIPIKLDQTKYNKSIRLDLIDLDYIDLTNPQNKKLLLERLYRTIRNRLGKPNVSEPIDEGMGKKIYVQKIEEAWKDRNILINILLCALGCLCLFGIWAGSIYWLSSIVGLIGVTLLLLNRGDGITFITAACFIWMLVNVVNSPKNIHRFFTEAEFIEAWVPLCVTFLTAGLFLLKKKGVQWWKKCANISVLSVICLTIISLGWLGCIFYDLIVANKGLPYNMNYFLRKLLAN